MTAGERAVSLHERVIGVALVLPLAGLGLLIWQPELDLMWEHHPSHFWLVLGTAAVSVALAYLTNEAANRRADARLSLISLAFLLSAGFLALHALATPGALLPEPNAGFVVATPVGLFLAACLAAASISPIAGPRAGWLLRNRDAIRNAAIALMVAWGVVCLLRLPPLRGALPAEEAVGPITALAVVAVPLFAIAAWRYFEISRRRREPGRAGDRGGAPPPRRGDDRGRAQSELAPLVVGVAPAHDGRVRDDRARDARRVPAHAVPRRCVRADLPRGDAGTDQPLARARDRGSRGGRGARASRPAACSTTCDATAQRPTSSTFCAKRRARSVASTSCSARTCRRTSPRGLRREPDATRLGGEERVVRSCSPTSPASRPLARSTRRPRWWRCSTSSGRRSCPVIEDGHGAIEHFAGDGVLVLFNSVVDQPDHVARAAGCARAILRATDPIAAAHPGWPRFRIGLNTGPAVVGNVGAVGRRSFASIGDTTNLGSRLMSAGEAGQIVLGPATWAALEPQIAAGTLRVRALGAVRVKGKREPVEAWLLDAPS